jgi:hypothetical protein
MIKHFLIGRYAELPLVSWKKLAISLNSAQINMLLSHKPVMMRKKHMISYIWNGSINTLFEGNPLSSFLPL